MPIDILTDALIVPSRDDLVARWERDVKIRMPGALVGDGTLPRVDAKIFADAILPVYGEAQRQANNVSLDGKTQDALNQEAKDLGLATLLPGAGSSGFGIVSTSVGGGAIISGTQAINPITGLRYQCTATALYTDQQNVPIAAVDTGPQTNVPSGTVLQWVSPPPGINQTFTVFKNSDGSGLSNGSLPETQQQMVTRLRNAKGTPAVAGNDAQYQASVMQTPSVGLQAPFTFPCLAGPGSVCVVFTVRPNVSGGSRIPNNAQIGTVKAWVTGQFPKDDSSTFAILVAQLVDLSLLVRWGPNSAGWADASPWPPYAAGQPVTAQAGGSATLFTVTTAAAPPTPQVGQTIALFDATNLRFVKKRILAVSGANPWTLTIDPSNNVSDTTYTPLNGDVVFPWSDSLPSLLPPIASYFDGIGPGEMKASFFDDGYREKRSPQAPLAWPNTITNAILTPIFALNLVTDTQVASPTLPLSTNVGTPGVSANLIQLNHIYAYAL